jgi:hypothetical protein
MEVQSIAGLLGSEFWIFHTIRGPKRTLIKGWLHQVAEQLNVRVGADMNQRDEKLKLITETIEFIETQPYDPGNCARYVYVKSLDAMAYRYGDQRLNTLLDMIGGMSAGEEFFYSRDELREMLKLYLLDA